jgi:hypothetical protein
MCKKGVIFDVKFDEILVIFHGFLSDFDDACFER